MKFTALIINSKLFFPVLISVIYFIHGLVTLPDYGINWDAPYHYQRGQAILRLFSTGKGNYEDYNNCKYLQGSFSRPAEFMRIACPTEYGMIRSFYQDKNYDLKYIKIQEDRGGHPPLNGLGAAITNTIFYRIFGLFEDTDSYKLFSLFVSSFSVFVVGLWATIALGKAAGFVSSLSLALYPFLIAERQINYKDPVASVFMLTAIFLFYMSIRNKKTIYLILSSLFIGLSLSSKFNIVFMPLVVFPWLVYYINKINLSGKRKHFKKTFLQKKWIISGLIFTVLPVVIFIGIWPYVWGAPINNTLKTIKYYIDIGSGKQYHEAGYYFFGIDTFPLLYLLYITPIPTLFLLLVGLLAGTYKLIKQKFDVYILFLLLLAVPLLRLSILSSYGGIRQAMETITGLSLVAGIGGHYVFNIIKDKISNKYVSSLVFGFIIILAYLPVINNILVIHPFENLYFNSLIGGVKGAKEKQFPGWDQDFGTSYYQGVKWINENAPKNSKLAFSIVGVYNRVPFTKLREDIKSGEKYWSGSERKGEYMIQTSLNSPLTHHYSLSFERVSLVPVHAIEADGTVVAYVYQNSKKYTKKEFQGEELELTGEVSYSQRDNEYLISLSGERYLTKLSYSYDKTCKESPNGWVYVLTDEGEEKVFEALAEQYYTLPSFDMRGNFTQAFYYIPLLKAKNVRILLKPAMAIDPNCPLLLENIKAYGI